MQKTLLKTQTKGIESRKRLQEYIRDTENKGDLIPNKNGALWLAEILRKTKLNRDQLKKNSGLRQILEDYAEEKGLKYSSRIGLSESTQTIGKVADGQNDMATKKQLLKTQQEIQRLETRNAALAAENAKLKLEKKSLEARETELVETGRRMLLSSLERKESVETS